MKFMLAALGLAALAACASTETVQTAAAPAFNPSACYERRFNIYYDQYDSALDAEAQDVVSAMDNSLRGCRIDHVRIVGLAGALGGSQQDNLELSQQRAATLADYLAAHTAWPRDKYELVARGDENATNDDGMPRPMRRRARVTVTASAP